MGNYYEPLVSGLVNDVDQSIEDLRAALESAGIRDVLRRWRVRRRAISRKNRGTDFRMYRVFGAVILWGTGKSPERTR